MDDNGRAVSFTGRFQGDAGVRAPAEARAKIAAAGNTEPGNLEEQAIRLVGRDIYERLIKGYTEK